jgi:hypothetical protein
MAARTNKLIDDPLDLVELVERPEPPQLAQVSVVGHRADPELDDRRRSHRLAVLDVCLPS